MFGGTKGRTMKWGTLLKDFREKVGLAQSPSATPASASASSPSSLPSNRVSNASSILHDFAPSPARDKHELELDFKRFWEEFRSSSSEKEKEVALNLTVDAFCRLVKQHANVAQLVTMLVETHIFSFVVGRAFVTDVEKLKMSSKSRSLNVLQVLRFFSEVTKDGICPGSNLLMAVEILVSGPIDKQSLLDSGILCCLIHILNAFLGPDEANRRPKASNSEDSHTSEKSHDGDDRQIRRLEVEGSVVHIMKALASHPAAAQSLIEDSSLQLLFQMVANGSLTVFSQYKEGLVPLHCIQLYRHAMQILGLLLVNDNGSTVNYIRKHHLVWLARNKLLYEGEMALDSVVLGKAQKLNSDFKAMLRTGLFTSPTQVCSDHWERPPLGLFKINVDGSVTIGDEFGGMGAVIRNHNGEVVASAFKRTQSAGGAVIVEAKAFLHGIHLAIDLNISNFILEGDALEVVNAISAQHVGLNAFGHVIDSIRALLPNVNCSIVYTPRSNNFVADSLARLGRSSSERVILLNEVPVSVRHSLAHDFMSFS